MYICKETFLAIHEDRFSDNISDKREKDFEVKKDTVWFVRNFLGLKGKVVLCKPKIDLIRRLDLIFLDYSEFLNKFDYFYLTTDELKGNDKYRELIWELTNKSTYDYYSTLLYGQKREAEDLMKTYMISRNSDSYLDDSHKRFLEKESRNLIGRKISVAINMKMIYDDLITEEFLASDVLKGKEDKENLFGSYVEVFDNIDIQLIDYEAVKIISKRKSGVLK